MYSVNGTDSTRCHDWHTNLQSRKWHSWYTLLSRAGLDTVSIQSDGSFYKVCTVNKFNHIRLILQRCFCITQGPVRVEFYGYSAPLYIFIQIYY